jgi:hypothetical protein
MIISEVLCAKINDNLSPITAHNYSATKAEAKS